MSIIERIRSIWKMTIKHKTPIIFRKLSPPSLRYQIPIKTKTSLGFLTKQISIQSFHTARETLSEEDISLAPNSKVL